MGEGINDGSDLIDETVGTGELGVGDAVTVVVAVGSIVLIKSKIEDGMTLIRD